MSIDITLDPEKLGAVDPKTLQKEVNDAIMEALEIVADMLVELIKQNVNVDTGTMRRSVRKEVIQGMVSVVMGGDQYINPKTNKPCDYAPAQEHINPTFEPALEMIKGDIESLISQKIQDRLTKLGITIE